MHEVLVNRLGGLSLPRKSVVRLTDRPDMTIDVYLGRKTTIQHRFEESSSYWSVKRISAFLYYSLVNQEHTSGITVYNRTVANIKNTAGRA